MTAAAHPPEAAKTATAKDLNATLARIRAAARDAGVPSYDARIESLEKLERALRKRKDAIAHGDRARLRQPLASTRRSWPRSSSLLGEIRHAKQHLRDWMEPEERETSFEFMPADVPASSTSRSASIGDHLALELPGVSSRSAPLVAALAAGNRAMIKPSELVPETAELLRDLVADAFPEDQVAVVTGGAEVGEAFSKLAVRSPRLHRLDARRQGRDARGEREPRARDAGARRQVADDRRGRLRHAAVAAERIMAGKTYNAGQTCIAPDYVMVPAASRDAFVEACKAGRRQACSPRSRRTPTTRRSSTTSTTRACARTSTTRRSAAPRSSSATRRPKRSTRRRARWRPRSCSTPTDEMLCMQEEIFGPVLPVLTYTRLDEALAYVNDAPAPARALLLRRTTARRSTAC